MNDPTQAQTAAAQAAPVQAAPPPDAPPAAPPAPAEAPQAGAPDERDPEVIRAEARKELEQLGLAPDAHPADSGLFAEGGHEPPPAEDKDPFGLGVHGLTVGDALVGEQPGADPDEVIHVNPRYIRFAKVGPVPTPQQPGQVQAAPQHHAVTVWLDSGHMIRLVHRWADKTRAEQFIREIKRYW